MTPAYDPADQFSARQLVEAHLRQLGLGAEVVTTPEGTAQQVVPEDIGWCRAQVLTEAAWPDGSDLAVLVSWHPDTVYARNHDTGHVPDGAEEYWRERITATADALESLGYVVERNGPPQSPHTHPEAELLVYRMLPEVAPDRLPPHAWEGRDPIPPHYQRPSWRPDLDPTYEVEAVLRDAGLARWPGTVLQPWHLSERCAVQPVTQTIWPPDAAVCAHVFWWPPERFQRSEDGDVPPGTQDYWTAQTDHVKAVLGAAGYTVRCRTRPWDPTVENCTDMLVHRPLLVAGAGGLP